MIRTIVVLVASSSVAVATPASKPLAACTDGGDFTGARVSADGSIRYCIDDTCFAFVPATRALTPISATFARAARAGDTTIVHLERYDAPEHPPVPTWRSSSTATTIEICGPAGCSPFPFVHLAGQPPPDDEEVAETAISQSGSRVAVVRGLEGAGKTMPIEIYDRASHKRLGVVRPKMRCTRLVGFAGESAIIQEWGCANQGGPRDIISPGGKAVARVEGSFANLDRIVHVDGDRWALLNPDEGIVQIYDVVTGKRMGHPIATPFTAIGAANNNVYAFETTGKLTVLDRDARVLATAIPPTCRWTWEHETIGPVRFSMTGPELRKILGVPKSTSKPDDDRKVTASYAAGLSFRLQTYDQSGARDPCGGGPQPAQIIEIDVTAPSKLTTASGIGIGSSLAALDLAYGSHRIAARSTATLQVFSNDADEPGWSFDIVDGKVAAIHVGRDPRDAR